MKTQVAVSLIISYQKNNIGQSLLFIHFIFPASSQQAQKG
jgi:hypothetical protein